jgi:hypothetical protein
MRAHDRTGAWASRRTPTPLRTGALTLQRDRARLVAQADMGRPVIDEASVIQPRRSWPKQVSSLTFVWSTLSW